MDLKEAKRRIVEIESELDIQRVVKLDLTTINNFNLITYLTPELRKNCKKNKIWKSKEFLITLKNIKYGIDDTIFRSKGGRDGIFVIDRNFRPRNSMQQKIFGQFIDKENSGFSDIVKELNLDPSRINGIRVVSHHMRLLGIHQRKENDDIVVLVNYDDSKT